MTRFKKLKHNESEFPHIGNVDVYKYDNDFDYQRFNAIQMSLQICTVPWDVGEAHVGNRTISGIGNVVWFGTKANRDAWFDAIPDTECFRFETKFKELHRDMLIDVPIPYDVCARHNYLRVKYNMFANDDSPVMYEDANGLREWFWFIREVEFIAPNTTRLHLLDDAFQTWMYDVTVSGMVLERGHAPMFATRAGDFLANPIANNANLLTEDVTFGDASQVAHIDAHVFNTGTMYACVASTGNPTSNWGSKSAGTWRVPANASYSNNGVPSVRVFAMESGDLTTFLSNLEDDIPQFKQTIQGVFLASSQLLDLGGSFSFAGVTCYNVASSRKTFDLCTLTKSQFGYEGKYSDIAKLYTYPYAHIEVTDENGNVDVIKIEDTTGNIDISAVLSLAYPFINIEAHLTGVGGTPTATITYRNLNNRTFPIAGRWYDTLKTWNVPTFAVVLDGATEYDYSSHFDRAQRVVDYNTAYNNAAATADANAANVATVSAAEKNNADASASTLVSNATLTTTANSAMTTISNGSADETLDNVRDYNFGVMDTDNAVIAATATSEISAAEEQAAVATASAVATGVVGAIASAASGDIAGAITSGINGAIGGATTIANTAITTGLTAAKASIAEASNSDHADLSTEKSANDTSMQQTTATSMTTAQNTLTSGVAANNAATARANATRAQTAQNTAAANTQATEKANAARSRTQAQSAISNDVSQAALRSPFVYGSFADGDTAASKPMALFANIVTQSKSAISAAGDEFMRYGYAYGKQWAFNGNWNIGKYFTYWKLSDFWVKNLNVPDMYMDKLRFFLFGGVTVWRHPEDIGRANIYDNYNEI